MIRVELKDDEISAALERLSAALTDMTPVMEDIGELLTRSTKERFVAGVDPKGNKWPGKSGTTLDIYQARGDRVDPRPLFGPSGRLSSEIAYTIGLDRKSVEIGSNQIYAAVMQFGAAKGSLGGGAPWGNIPARPFMGLSDRDQTNILETIDEWLERATNAAG